ncbi:hypothetical protein [Cryobacterium sp. LW097]|uniref:hypothetical protein n=1 Tax=Cryobacterium sp. LW097 TaxID=1978566 RepID=UPI001247F4A0|nr:hypothetical protein [Cryobacterium sp. LW097]
MRSKPRTVESFREDGKLASGLLWPHGVRGIGGGPTENAWCWKTIGLALLALLTLTGRDERPFTRADAISTPNSAIQVGGYRDRTWEYVDGAGTTRELNRCEDTSPWNVAYSCTSPDRSVKLTFNLSKFGIRNPTLHVGDEEMPLYCINDGFWGGGLRFCLPETAPAIPTSRRNA